MDDLTDIPFLHDETSGNPKQQSRKKKVNDLMRAWAARGRLVERDGPERLIERTVEVEKVIEVPVEVFRKDPGTEARLADALSKLEAAQAKVEERKPEPVQEQPPADISDLIDPNLTARQNHDALTKKYKDAMSDHYRLLSYGTQEHKIEAQKQLEKAQRYESGIAWNRPRLAEVL